MGLLGVSGSVRMVRARAILKDGVICWIVTWIDVNEMV